MKPTLEQVKKAMPKAVKLDTYYPHLVAALEQFAINTPLRVAHFLAQVGHESLGFVYMEELASGIAYEGRKDLGNTQAGDGKRYKGRGVIQITGRANYKAVGEALGHDFVSDPEALEKPEWAFKSAGWFWKKNGLNELADADNVEKITRRINGGLNGFEDRKVRLEVAKKALV